MNKLNMIFLLTIAVCAVYASNFESSDFRLNSVSLLQRNEIFQSAFPSRVITSLRYHSAIVAGDCFSIEFKDDQSVLIEESDNKPLYDACYESFFSVTKK